MVLMLLCASLAASVAGVDVDLGYTSWGGTSLAVPQRFSDDSVQPGDRGPSITLTPSFAVQGQRGLVVGSLGVGVRVRGALYRNPLSADPPRWRLNGWPVVRGAVGVRTAKRLEVRLHGLFGAGWQDQGALYDVGVGVGVSAPLGAAARIGVGLSYDTVTTRFEGRPYNYADTPSVAFTLSREWR